jgi:histidinol-phosphate/aromatic aminotransferase/cobyric acid decarboxylase-like protein
MTVDVLNGAGFRDAACVSYYRTIRADVSTGARQIGYGVNKMPPAAPVRRWLDALFDELLDDRVTDYSTSDDVRERALVAELAGRYLGVPLSPESVFFCHGTTEAISIVFGYAGLHGLDAVLPLPLYCSFEQSAARHRVPVVAHYNAAGRLVPGSVPAGRPLLLVEIAPNGVSGSWFESPELREPELRIVDHVFALPTHWPRPVFLAELRRRIGDLSRTAVFLSPSKDLAIPGLRCGTLITRHPGLSAYALADRFERGYTVWVGTPRIAAAHLALLLLAFRPDGGAAQLREAFGAAGVAFPTDIDCAAFLAHLADLEHRAATNLGLLDGTGFLVPMAGEHMAGYSGFRRIDGAAADADAFTGWIHRAGRYGLKLNPNYLFGADPARWRALYGTGHGIRVNLSVPPDQLAIDLALLRRLLPARSRSYATT